MARRERLSADERPIWISITSAAVQKVNTREKQLCEPWEREARLSRAARKKGNWIKKYAAADTIYTYTKPQIFAPTGKLFPQLAQLGFDS